MRWLRSGSEAEMIALFLRTELPSDRWRDRLQTLLQRAGLPERLVTDPDLHDEAENQARLRLLTAHRDYGTRTNYFDGFPDEISWQWMAITAAELTRVRYIDYDYWDELSGGTRLAVDAAARIRVGITSFGVPNEVMLATARAVADGAGWGAASRTSARSQSRRVASSCVAVGVLGPLWYTRPPD